MKPRETAHNGLADAVAASGSRTCTRNSVSVPVLWFIEFLLLLLWAASPSHAFVFVENSQPACYIVVRPDAPRAELFAAGELAAYLEQMTGVNVPVRRTPYSGLPAVGRAVLIGQGVWLDQPRFGDAGDDINVLGPQSILIRSSLEGEPPCLIVAGGSPRGTVYAVYELLRILGVRWYAPEVTRVPHYRTVEIGEVDLVDFPCFPVRNLNIGNDDMTPEWAAQLRLTSPNGYLEYAQDCLPVSNPIRLSLADMFARIDVTSQKRPDTSSERPCYFTSEAVSAALADSLNVYSEHNPGVTEVVLALGAQDIAYRLDTCPRGLELSPGPVDFLLQWADRLNDMMRRDGHVRLFLSLPREYGKPPLKVKLPDTVGVVLGVPGHDYRLPYMESVDHDILTFIDDLKTWGEHVESVRLTIPLGHAVHPAVPFPDNRQAAGNMIMFRDAYVSGLEYVFNGCPGCYVADADMLVWVLSRLMWDSDADPGELEREWIKGVFGNAWGPMADYHEHVSDLARKSQLPIDRTSDPLTYIDSEWISTAERMLQRAFAQSMTDSTAHRCVQRSRLGVQYLRLLDIQRTLDELGAYPRGYTRTGAESLLGEWRTSMALLGYDRVSSSLTAKDFAEDITASLEKNR